MAEDDALLGATTQAAGSPSGTPGGAQFRAPPVHGLSAQERWQLQDVYHRIDVDGFRSFNKFQFLAAVVQDPVVCSYMLPRSAAADTLLEDRALAQAEQAWEAISCFKTRISYDDLAAYFHTKAMLEQLYEKFGVDRGTEISKVKFVAKMVNTPALAVYLIPWVEGGASADKGQKTQKAEEVFERIASGRPAIDFEQWVRYCQQGTQLQYVFARMDPEDNGTISKFEFLGAVASDDVVAKYLLRDVTVRRTASSEQRLGDIDRKFKIISCGKERVTYADLESHFTRAKAAGTGLLALEQDTSSRALVPVQSGAGHMDEESMALVPQAVDLEMGQRQSQLSQMSSRRSQNSQMAVWKKKKQDPFNPTSYLKEDTSLLEQLGIISKMDHPLETDMVAIADQEVRMAIWGPIEDTGKVIYEFNYKHFPYFCCFISFIQLAAYFGTIDRSLLSLSGPVSKPEAFYLRVYDEHCNDLRHEIWRLWAYQWCHASVTHVFTNVFGNLVIGGLLEAVHGTWNIASLYTIGVITGGLTMGTLQPHVAVVGCSGGVYTMIGARISNLILNGDQMPQTYWFRVFMVGFFVTTDTVSFFTSYHAGTSYAAHFGGWLCGLLFGASCLENLVAERWEAKFILLCKRIFLLYMVFCLVWYATQTSGAPQGLFDGEGRCSFQAAPSGH